MSHDRDARQGSHNYLIQCSRGIAKGIKSSNGAKTQTAIEQHLVAKMELYLGTKVLPKKYFPTAEEF